MRGGHAVEARLPAFPASSYFSEHRHAAIRTAPSRSRSRRRMRSRASVSRPPSRPCPCRFEEELVDVGVFSCRLLKSEDFQRRSSRDNATQPYGGSRRRATVFFCCSWVQKVENRFRGSCSQATRKDFSGPAWLSRGRTAHDRAICPFFGLSYLNLSCESVFLKVDKVRSR